MEPVASRVGRAMDVGGHQDGSTCLVFVLLLSHFLSGSDASGGWWNHGAPWQGWTMDPAKQTVLLDRKSKVWVSLSCQSAWGSPTLPPGTLEVRVHCRAATRKHSKNSPCGQKLRWKEDRGSKIRSSSPTPRRGWAGDTELWDGTAAVSLNMLPARGPWRGSLRFRKCGETSRRSKQEQGTPIPCRE